MPKSKQPPRKIAPTYRANSAPAAVLRESEKPESRRRTWALCFLLGISVLAVDSPVRHYPFINYDDPSYVANNPHVQTGLTLATIKWSVTTMNADNWHPLTWLSHALDCELFGLDAGWHHITNVLLHIASVVLLYLLLLRVTGAPGRSFVVAGLFALHPMNVGTVAWIAERKNVLSTLFLLLTVGCYGWYARRPGVRRYLLVALLFALGLAAKPMIVTLPFALLLLDYWPLQRVKGWITPAEQFRLVQLSPSRLLLEKLPLLVLSVASSVITLIAQQTEVGAAAIPLGARLANAICSYFLYIWKTFWPAGFSIFYPHPFANPAAPFSMAAWLTIAGSGLFLIAVTALAWWQRQTRPYLITGWLWYLGSLVPVIGIVRVGSQGMADRYAYIPLIGIFVIIAWGGNDNAERLRVPVVWRAGLAALVLTALAVVSSQQLAYWRTSLDLWSHALAVSPNNYYAEDQIGDLLTAEQNADALQHYRAAAQIAPWDPTTQMPLAVYLQQHGLLAEAIPHYKVVVHNSVDRRRVAFAYVDLCLIFGELGDDERAHEAFTRAVRGDPKAVQFVIGDLAQSVGLQHSEEKYFALGLLLEQSGQLASAREAYLEASKLNSEWDPIRKALSRLQSGTPQNTTP